MTGAIIGGSVLSAGANFFGAQQAGKAADAAQAQQMAYLNKNLEFQMQQYQQWQKIYGPIQKNLANFYKHLTPETLAASGIKHYEQQYRAVEQELQRSFAQRGIDSPAQDFLNQHAALSAAEAKAQIRQQAPLQVAQAKQGFLASNVSNPNAAGVSNAFGQFANVFGQQAQYYQQQQAAGIQGIGNAISGGLQQYIGMQTPGLPGGA